MTKVKNNRKSINNSNVKKQKMVAEKEQEDIILNDIELFNKRKNEFFTAMGEAGVEQVRELSPIVIGILSKSLLNKSEDDIMSEVAAKKVVDYYNKYFTPKLPYENLTDAYTILQAVVSINLTQAEHNKKK